MRATLLNQLFIKETGCSLDVILNRAKDCYENDKDRLREKATD